MLILQTRETTLSIFLATLGETKHESGSGGEINLSDTLCWIHMNCVDYSKAWSVGKWEHLLNLSLLGKNLISH